MNESPCGEKRIPTSKNKAVSITRAIQALIQFEFKPRSTTIAFVALFDAEIRARKSATDVFMIEIAFNVETPLSQELSCRPQLDPHRHPYRQHRWCHEIHRTTFPSRRPILSVVVKSNHRVEERLVAFSKTYFRAKRLIQSQILLARCWSWRGFRRCRWLCSLPNCAPNRRRPVGRRW
jgi:hypothetical protein